MVNNRPYIAVSNKDQDRTFFIPNTINSQQDLLQFGYKEFIVKPAFHDSLQWAKGHHVSSYGKINVSWVKTDEDYLLELTVPHNTSSTLFIPARAVSDILENNKPIKSSGEIKLLGFENNIAELRLGSGAYHFKVNYVK